MKIIFITPASTLRRIPFYRWGGKIYGQSNSITGPLILGSILKEYGRRRVGLAAMARLGVFGAHLASRIKNTPYYRIRHTEWRPGEQNEIC